MHLKDGAAHIFEQPSLNQQLHHVNLKAGLHGTIFWSDGVEAKILLVCAKIVKGKGRVFGCQNTHGKISPSTTNRTV